MEFSVGFFRFLYLISMVLVVALTVIYCNQLFHMVTSIFLRKKTWPDARRRHAYACIIPANNEEVVIGDLIDSIQRQDYPQELLQVFVVADNCSDRTAEIARGKGVHVLVRDNPLEIGKSYALDYAFKRILSMDPAPGAEGYFIFDADNVLAPDYISQMNKVFDSGEEIVSGFRDSKNFSANWVSGVNSYMFLRESRQIHYSRAALGIGSFVSGTGFLIAEGLIRQAGGWPYRTLTEDIELSADYTARGGKIAYCTDAVFYDEQPCSLWDTIRQRLRWCRGIHQIFARRLALCKKDVVAVVYPRSFDYLLVGVRKSLRRDLYLRRAEHHIEREQYRSHHNDHEYEHVAEYYPPAALLSRQVACGLDPPLSCGSDRIVVTLVLPDGRLGFAYEISEITGIVVVYLSECRNAAEIHYIFIDRGRALSLLARIKRSERIVPRAAAQTFSLDTPALDRRELFRLALVGFFLFW